MGPGPPVGVTPHRVQRLAAYVVAVRGETILLAQQAGWTPFPGRWNLPGGGVDHGEDPRDAAVREVYEETGLVIELGEVLETSSSHYVYARPDGTPEDFHAVRIVFSVHISECAAPRVIEIDGSTAASAWIPIAALPEMDLMDVVSEGLAAHRRRGASRG